MKVAIVHARPPFVRGLADVLADGLSARLAELGHHAEVISLPVRWGPESSLLDGVMVYRLLRIDAGDPDLVIGLNFPAYLAPHPNRKVWLLQQFRQAYDWWGTPRGHLLDTPEGRTVRDLVVAADTTHLGTAAQVYAPSRKVAGRLRRHNGLDVAGVLCPPVVQPELFRPGQSGDYFFYPGVLSSAGRQHLAVEAMRHVRSPFRLVIAGTEDEPGYDALLRDLIGRWGLNGRVELVGGLSEEERARWTADAVTVLCLPVDEDHGHPVVEAFQAHKPVLTLSDSGGPAELVEDGRNGLVVGPTPEELADGMERAWANRGRAAGMGQEAHATITRFGIEWPRVLERLVA